MAEDILAIETKRRVLKVPTNSLCAQAGVGRQTYADAVAGIYEPRAATIAKLAAALGRFRRSSADDDELGALSAHGAFKSAQVIAAFALNAEAKANPPSKAKDDISPPKEWMSEARAVLLSDPKRKATANADWMSEARARRLAYWIANGLLGLRTSDVARAADVSKQAVSLAIREIMDGRDSDASLDRVCRQLEEIFEP